MQIARVFAMNDLLNRLPNVFEGRRRSSSTSFTGNEIENRFAADPLHSAMRQEAVRVISDRIRVGRDQLKPKCGVAAYKYENIHGIIGP